MHACRKDCTDVPAATAGPRTSYHVLEARAEFPDTLRGVNAAGHKSARARFLRLLEKARIRGQIVETVVVGTDRHRKRVLVLADPIAAAANDADVRGAANEPAAGVDAGNE